VADASSGFVLDGYPRTLSQCEALEDLFGADGIELALEIDVPANIVIDRVRARGRADDDPEVVLRRLWEYERQTRVVSDWFERQARLVYVDGTGTADAVAADVLAAVNHWFDRLDAFA
jgi:adenylate kinase